MPRSNLSVIGRVAIIFVTLYGTAMSASEIQSPRLNGKQYFNKQEYAKAYPLLQKEANGGSKGAMYRLAYMYEKGLGVEKDPELALYWYKRAASAYAYVLEDQTGVEGDFFQRLEDQLEPKTNKEGTAYALNKMDTDTPETSAMLNSILDGDFFGLQPYRSNYFLPVSYASSKYRRLLSETHSSNYTERQEENGYYGENTEVEFQLSFKKPLTYDLFGWSEAIIFGYTQKVWWQLYTASAPFRETNYMPEVYLNVPTSESIDEASGLKAVKIGLLHESNGQEGYRSRSWNRLYLTGMWQWKNLFLASRLWYRLPESKKYEGYYDGAVNPLTGEHDPNASGDDNPDIENYLGYGDLKIDYLYRKHQFGSLLRYNFGAGGKSRGALEFNWSYPFFNSENTFWYVKLFSGYGESLIDYDRSVTKAAFGFSFSRALY